MTTLVLSVVCGPAGIAHETRPVSNGGFAIGRDDRNDWVLDDPDCILSKRHCMFHQNDAGWSVTDLSRNGLVVTHEGDDLAVGASAFRLSASDRLKIGNYELTVDLQEDEASFRVVPLAQFAAQAAMRSASGTWTHPSLLPGISKMAAIKQIWPPGPKSAEPAHHFNPRARIARAPAPRPIAATAMDALFDATGLARQDLHAIDPVSAGRAAGMALRPMVRGLRRARAATLAGIGNHERVDRRANPLQDAPDERTALAWLLMDRGHMSDPAEAIETAFEELRLHQACLLQAARESLRDLLASIDPDEPERHLAPSWLDLMPGWRRARAPELARRHYRRLKVGLDKNLDPAIERAYAKAWREAIRRWDAR